ncbi:MAG TPA: ABC transporter substrate-binding protein [Jiangellaceae bacterium]
MGTFVRRRALRMTVGLAAFTLLAAGCGDDGGDTAEDDTGAEDAAADDDMAESPTPEQDAGAEDMEPVSLTVGDVLGTPSAFLQFAVNEGFFEEQGLDVTVEANPGGAANIPGVESGEFQIAGSNVVSVLLARAQGLELQMISAGTFGGESPETDFAQILVAEDSDIQGPEDLDGRSVAINTLANIAEVTTRAAIQNAGGSHENIDFVEIGFPDMIPALQDGQVDAIFEIEPFVSVGLDQGLRSVLAPYAGTEPGMAIGSYFSSDAYIAENPEVIDRFIAGISAAGEHIAANPEEFRTALVEIGGQDPEVAEQVVIPNWGGPVDVPSVELIADLMLEFGMVDELPPVEDAVYE